MGFAHEEGMVFCQKPCRPMIFIPTKYGVYSNNLPSCLHKSQLWLAAFVIFLSFMRVLLICFSCKAICLRFLWFYILLTKNVTRHSLQYILYGGKYSNFVNLDWLQRTVILKCFLQMYFVNMCQNAIMRTYDFRWLFYSHAWLPPDLGNCIDVLWQVYNYPNTVFAKHCWNLCCGLIVIMKFLLKNE